MPSIAIAVIAKAAALTNVRRYCGSEAVEVVIGVDPVAIYIII